MQERDKAYLLDILESARLALAYVEERSSDDLAAGTQLQDAVIRRFIIIGEAASHVSESLQREYSDLPWREMVGMRNLLVHRYGDIDLTTLWDSLQSDLSPLVTRLTVILGRPD